MRPRARRAAARRGTAAVEFAVSLLVASPLLIGLWEAGRLVEVQQILDNAAREGGRQAASGKITSSQVQQVVLTYLQAAGLPSSKATVTIYDLTNPNVDSTNPPNADPTVASQLDQLQVTVSINFKDVRWTTLQLVTSSSTQLTSQVIWYSIKDQPFPDPYTPPAGN